MAEDARYRTKVWLDTYITKANLTKDDDSTQVRFRVMYANPDYPFKKDFKHFADPTDLFFIIDTPNSTAMPGHDQYPIGYEEHVPIEVACIDKTGITGTLLRWKAVKELRKVAEDNPFGSQRSLEEERPNDKRLGSLTVYSQRVILNYRRDTT
jgi:hypothetical protein